MISGEALSALRLMDIKRNKLLCSLLLMAAAAGPVSAQRHTDRLDRGLVAVVPRNGSGIFLSWRIQADEYYDVTYNVYRDGTKLNATPLTVSNYMDASGNASCTYTVCAVVGGVEQAACEPAKHFSTSPNSNGAGAPAYLYIRMKDVVDRNGNVVYSNDGTVCTWNYTLNDACLADLDGDGEVEIIVKRINATDAAMTYPDGTAKEMYEKANTTAYTIFEAYKMDGTRLWWIDCGPNMVSLNSTEVNCVAYDWDEDGRAEVVMRGADNMIIHKADGSVYNVGDMGVNTRDKMTSHTNAQYAWTHTGAEYLLYLDGTTATPYSVTDFPLKRLESGESSEKSAWGDDYGHRSSKYFFGAPVLDGRKASIFLARGIYTRTKMIALDVDPATHALTTRWEWSNNTSGSVWYGQGNHNYTVADVDGDGCDEIVYGSMVIDNNGKGLSSTGLGHGDAMHVGDLDPYRPGQEVFACNEEKPNCNFRNATTSEIYYRSVGSGDDGRALMGNFTNDYPGCVGRSVHTGLISSVADTENNSAGGIAWGNLNGRIYWDGDLLEEYFNSPGTERECMVLKINDSRIMQTCGVGLINDSKNNPCAQGDIIGDWREELVMRSSDNNELRIYSTDVPTTWRIPSLWYDHQYRQAMVWQVCAYNQPPHASFFLGELEGITRAPLPLTDAGRTELSKNDVIGAGHSGTAVMLCEAGSYGIDAAGASPSLLVVNVASTVSGNNGGAIGYSYSQTQLGATIGGTDYKGDLTGAMHFVKQGDGLLKLTARTFSYTGDTEIWGGSLFFRGTLQNSNVWMNRHTNFFCGADIKKKLTMEYGATLYPSKNAVNAANLEYATAKVGTLEMHEGSRIVFQLSDTESDAIEVATLNIRCQSWQLGPKYLAPVFEIQPNQPLAQGKYCLGSVYAVTGRLSDIILECSNLADPDNEMRLELQGGQLYLIVGNLGLPEYTWEEMWRLDFEEESSNHFGFTGNCSFIWQENADGTHCFHADQNGGSGDRSANISFASNAVLASATDYKFEFDWGHSVSNQNASRTTVLADDNATLFYIDTPKYGASSLYDAGDSFISNITNDGYSKACPVKLTHFVITSNAGGTYLTATYDGGTVIDNVKLSDGLQHITAINTTLGRAVSHMVIDDIILSERRSSIMLSDVIQPLYGGGLYNSVNIERHLVSGYNTLCLPFSTTPQTVAGSGAVGYTLSRVTESANAVYLCFDEVDCMEANHPYLLYVPEDADVPSCIDITIEEPKPYTVTVDGWQFVSNYVPHLSMQGKYVVAGDNLRPGGAGAWLNGMRAYFVAPSSASVKQLSLSFGDADGISSSPSAPVQEVIYSASGMRRDVLGKGVNIVRMKDGTFKKVYTE